MNMELPKHLLSVGGDSVIRHTVRAFERAGSIDSIVIVCAKEQISKLCEQTAEFKKVIAVTEGGESRMESARLGFSLLPDEADMIAIHDGARCLILPEEIDLVVSEAKKNGCATAGAAVVDTVKYTVNGMSSKTVPRDSLFLAHTPQVFDREIYASALGAATDISAFTDDNSLVEAMGVSVKCVDTGRTNIKLTTPEDLSYAEFILSKRGGK